MGSKKYGLGVQPGWAKHKRNFDRPFWSRLRVREPQVIRAQLKEIPECCEGRGCFCCNPPCPKGTHEWEGTIGNHGSWSCAVCGVDGEEPSLLELLAETAEPEPCFDLLMRRV